MSFLTKKNIFREIFYDVILCKKKMNHALILLYLNNSLFEKIVKRLVSEFLSYIIPFTSVKT